MLMLMNSLLTAQAVTVDNNASMTTTSGSPSVTTFTLSFTLSANNNRFLLVCVTNTVNANAPTVTFNSIPMTQLATRQKGGLRVTTYYSVLGSSASATTADIVANGTTNMKNIGAISFYNVQQSTPFDGQVSNDIQALSGVLPSTFSLTVSSRIDDMVCDCVAGGGVNGATGLTADAGQTEEANNFSAGTPVIMGMSVKAGTSPNVNMGWTINGTLGTGQAVFLGVNIRSTNAPLPVELTYFRGQSVKNGNQLLWQTATELNNKGFYTQRSKDGAKWQDLAFESGKGTSLKAHNYEWIDKVPMPGVNYYRLKQVDNDGSFKFSPVIVIIEGRNDKILVYPNPTSGDLFYESDDLNSVKRIQLYDATGKLLQETTNISGQFSIIHLPSGLYWFLIQTNNGHFYERIVKQ
jgi:hypothetical protein